MMIYPPIAELVKRAGSRYALVIETAKRARQRSKDDKHSDSSKEVAIAAGEIYDGKLTAVLPSQLQQHRAEAVEDMTQDNENITDEESTETEE